MVAPTREDPVAAALSDRAGGPAGDHAGGHWWWTPVRVLLAVCTVVFGLALVQHTPCVRTGWNDDAARYQAMCYSDIPYLYTGRGLAEQHWPYAASERYPAMEYPVGISYAAWAVAELTSLAPQGPPEGVRAASPVDDLWGLPGMSDEASEYFFLTALLLFGCAMGTAVLLAGCRRRRPWDACPFVLSPALLLAGLINWDLLAVVCVAGALFAWARGRPGWAGVAVGIGTATKLYPLFLLGAFLVPALRRDRSRVDRVAFARATGTAALAWLVAEVPAWLSGDFSRWTVFWSFNADRGPDLGSWWLVLSHLGATAGAGTVNLVSWVLFGGACVAIAVLGVRAPQAPRIAQVGFLVVTAFLLVNKVYSPQYVLWLLPLAVLARPRWRDLLIWQACELCYFAAVWWWLGGYLEGSTGGTPTYDLAIVVRIVGELYLAWRVVRDVWHPEQDPVRWDEARDAMGAGGPAEPGQASEKTTRSNLVVV